MKLFKKFAKMLEMLRMPRVLAHIQNFRWQPPYLIGKLAFSLLKTEITKCSITINLKLTNQIFGFRDFEAKTHLIYSFLS